MARYSPPKAWFYLQKQRQRRDGDGGGEIVSEAVNTVRPSISGNPFVGEEQAGDVGVWTGAEAFQYLWRLNTVAVGYDETHLSDSAGTLVFQVRGQDANGIWSPWYSSDPMEITAGDLPETVLMFGDEPLTYGDEYLIYGEA